MVNIVKIVLYDSANSIKTKMLVIWFLNACITNLEDAFCADFHRNLFWDHMYVSFLA
jgi:hypothetical protein